MTAKERYYAAHYAYQCRVYPSVVKDGHYTRPIYPKTNLSGGLTTFIINIITWDGGYANRINVQGRMIGKITKASNGGYFDDRKMIKSATKKGTADIDSIIKSRPVKIEVKIGADFQSDKQIAEQARIEAAGGVYIIAKNPEDFLLWYDQFVILAG